MTLPYAANRAESLTPPTNSPHDEAAQSRVEALAAAVERMGMSGVARVLLSTFKPAAWAGSQMLWIAQPFFGARHADPTAGIAGLARFLESESNIDALLQRLDAGPGSRDEGGR